MNKAFYMHVVYADCSDNAKGFEPKVFRIEFDDPNVLKAWLKDSDNLKVVVITHAVHTGMEPGAVFLKAVYATSEMCEVLGLPDDGTKLEDVIACLFKRWFSMKQKSGAFPTI